MTRKVNRFFPILCKYFVISWFLFFKEPLPALASLAFCVPSIDNSSLVLYNM